MQLLEASFLSLRSARHVLQSTKFAPTITLFPMVHVADALFYQEVYEQAADHDLVLFEGVKSKKAKALTRAYRSLPVKRLGLVVQPKFDPSIVTGDARRTDISGEAFDALWGAVPLLSKLALQAGSAAFALGIAPFMTRPRLAKHLSLDVLKSRHETLDQGHVMFSAMDRIDAARDRVLCEALEGAILGHSDQPFSIAVIYGAKHMQTFVRHVQQFGNYTPRESDWMTVFEL